MIHPIEQAMSRNGKKWNKVTDNTVAASITITIIAITSATAATTQNTHTKENHK